jgi:hypothetical protein
MSEELINIIDTFELEIFKKKSEKNEIIDILLKDKFNTTFDYIIDDINNHLGYGGNILLYKDHKIIHDKNIIEVSYVFLNPEYSIIHPKYFESIYKKEFYKNKNKTIELKYKEEQFVGLEINNECLANDITEIMVISPHYNTYLLMNDKEFNVFTNDIYRGKKY